MRKLLFFRVPLVVGLALGMFAASGAAVPRFVGIHSTIVGGIIMAPEGTPCRGTTEADCSEIEGYNCDTGDYVEVCLLNSPDPWGTVEGGSNAGCDGNAACRNLANCVCEEAF